MTRKETERRVREQMQQSLPNKDALWARIEQNLGEQKPEQLKPSPAIRMQTVYRVMGAAACLMLILGGIGIFAAVSGHSMREETATMTADNAVVQEKAEEMEAAADDAVYDENAAMDAAADAELDYGASAGIAADGEKTAADDTVQEADNAVREALAGEQNAVSSAHAAQNAAIFANAAREWITEFAPEVIPTITNWDAPEVTQVDTLPADYALVTEGHGSAPYWRVHFTTTQDAELGTEDLYVDADGVVFALSLRE